MNYFIKILNFIFTKENIEIEKIRNILKERIIYFPKDEKIVFFPYKNSHVKNAIWSMKFRNNFSACEFFGNIIYEHLPEVLQDLALSKNFIDPILINIPLSSFKKMSRGYDQNNLVIGSFIKQGGDKFILWEKNVLIKTKHTKAQSHTKNREQRSNNIKNSFGVKNAEKIQGRNIILFDDVLTTGSTIKEASATLKKAGAKKIIFMVIAH
jgi:competence protein ComFC